MKSWMVVFLLVGCSPRTSQVSALLDEPGCVCACTEAGTADAPPDVSVVDAVVDTPPSVDLTVPWARTIITPGAATGMYRGADGIAIDPESCYVTAWEEGGIVTRACPVGAGWATELVASGLTGPEDAKAADLDGDGDVDVAIAADSGQRVYVTFRGAPNVTITLTQSLGHGHAMQVAVADVDGDGLTDILVGTRVGSPAEVAWYANPGAALARTGSAWTRHFISPAGWVMSLEVVGGRIVVSDRASYKDAGGVTRWDLYGARWLELVSGVWVNHPISWPSGPCSPYASPTCVRTPGDEMFLTVDGNTVYDCTSTLSQADSRVSIHRTTDWLTWTHETLPPVANVGACQGVIPADVDHDGLTDLIVTARQDDAIPVRAGNVGKSGVYGLHALPGGTYERFEISGGLGGGGKFDNGLLRPSTLLTTEQLDPAGGFGVVMYASPWGSP